MTLNKNKIQDKYILDLEYDIYQNFILTHNIFILRIIRNVIINLNKNIIINILNLGLIFHDP